MKVKGSVTRLIKKRLPIVTWLPHYTLAKFFQDFLAGITVGMTEIPQGIAYAALAGLPPEYGLYSGLSEGFIYAIFGNCKDLNIGPSSLTSIMVLPGVLKIGPQGAILMTFLSGIVILVLAILQLGFITHFFSYPVISGFICSGCLVIIVGQLINLLGISGRGNSFIENCTILVENIGTVKKWDATLGLTSLVFLIVLRKSRVFGSLSDKQEWSACRNLWGKIIFVLSLASNALVLIVGTLLSYGLDTPFTITGQVAEGYPTFKPPPFSTQHNGTTYDFEAMVSNIGFALIFIPLISILEALTFVKLFSEGRAIDGTQEMLALGLCNIVGCFLGSMPVTGSLSRSMINNVSGVKTTLGGVFTSLLLLLTIAFFTSSFYYVPKATLAAILISVIIFLIDYKACFLFWKTKKLDFIPFFTTFFVGLLIGTDYGIMCGAVVNVLFVLYGNARPKIDIEEQDNVYVVTPRDTLFFPAAEYIRDTIAGFKGTGITVVIDGKYIRSMDVTVAKSIVIITEELTAKESKVILVNFKESIRRICVGVDKKVEKFFLLEEEYQNVIKDLSNNLVIEQEEQVSELRK